MPKKKSSSSSSSSNPLMHYKHLIGPSAGGVVAYALSGLVMLGLIIFGVVWVANLVSHKLHHKS